MRSAMSADRPQRIGKGGASALAPANTLQSLDAALDVGVDMVEFDVRRWRGDLVLAHTVFDACRGTSVRLQEALAHLSSPRFSEVGINVDVKGGGFERELLDALRASQLLERTLLSSQVAAVLDRLRALEPRARTGISIGGVLSRLAQGRTDWRRQVLDGLATSRWDALMAHHGLIDARLLEEVVEHGGYLYAWTVNERSAIQSLWRLGVHGITTADPRLFSHAGHH